MRVKNWIFIKNKWANLDNKCNLILSTLTIKIIRIYQLTQGPLMVRQRNNFIWVYLKCTQKINFHLWLLGLKMKEWSYLNNLERKINRTWLNIPIISRKWDIKYFQNVREINLLKMERKIFRNMLSRKKYLVAVRLCLERWCHQLSNGNRNNKRKPKKKKGKNLYLKEQLLSRLKKDMALSIHTELIDLKIFVRARLKK